MGYKYVKYGVEDGIATIQLNRPEALNALNADVNRDIAAALDEVKADKSVRVLILTGSHRTFAAGADVKEMAEATPRYAREFSALAISINNTLESIPIPTIAAVGGYAFGGGCEMPLSCDFRVGGKRTTMSFPEVGLGIIPGANGCARLTALLGASKAKELIMLTPTIGGKEAYHLGLLNWYVTSAECERLNEAAAEAKAELSEARKSGDEKAEAAAKEAFKLAEAAASEAEYCAIRRKALEIAEQLRSRPACALAAAKAAINKSALETVSAGKAAENAEFTLLFDTHDQKEGMAAMIAKRAPEFRNC